MMSITTILNSIQDLLYQYGFLYVGGIASFFAARNSYLEKKEENKQQPNKSNSRNVISYRWIVGGLILAVVSGTCSNWQQEHDKIEAKNEASANKHAADSLNRLLSDKQSELANKQNELNDTQKEIIGLQHKQNDTLRDILSASLSNNTLQNLVIKQEQIQIDTLKNVLSTSLSINKLQQKLSGLQDEVYNNIVGDTTTYPYVMIEHHIDTSDQNHYHIQFIIGDTSKYPLRGIKYQIYKDHETNELGVTKKEVKELYPRETQIIESLKYPVHYKELPHWIIALQWGIRNVAYYDFEFVVCDQDTSYIYPRHLTVQDWRGRRLQKDLPYCAD